MNGISAPLRKLRRTDPLVFDLLNKQGFTLPAMVPDGGYGALGD